MFSPRESVVSAPQAPSQLNSSSDRPGSPTSQEQRAPDVDALVGREYRAELRKLADTMHESGALRIKDHWEGVQRWSDTFKGEYARNWILSNVAQCRGEADALRIAQAMLQLGAFHDPISHGTTFSPQRLYKFYVDEDARAPVLALKERVIAAEDELMSQTKLNQQLSSSINAKHVQLDWRISVSEHRAAALEHAVRHALAVQQLLIAGVFSVLAARYLPLPAFVGETTIAVVVPVLFVLLVHSCTTLNRLLSIRIDYQRIARNIMGHTDMAQPQSSALTDEEASRSESQDRSVFSVLSRLSRSVHGCLSFGRLRAVQSGPPALCAKSGDTSGSVVAGRRSHSAEPPTSRRTRLPLPVASMPMQLLRRSAESAAVPQSAAPSRVQPSPPQSAAPSRVQRSPPRGHPDVARRSSPGSFSSASQSPSPSPRRQPPSGALSSRAAHGSDPGIGAGEAAFLGTGPPAPSEFEAGANHDLLVRQPRGPITLTSQHSSHIDVNSGREVAFDGPNFSGKIAVYLDGLPQPDDADVFEGKKRQSWTIIQGRFKERVATSEVFTGQLFERELKRLPHFVMSTVTQIINSFARVVRSASLVENREGLHCVMFPLILGAQAICVSQPGQEPSMKPGDEKEDISLLVPDLQGSNPDKAEEARLRHFQKEENRKAVFFEPEHVYTFHVAQHVVHIPSYCLTLPFLGNYNLFAHLNGQPIRFMAVHRGTREYYWNLEAWHRGLLKDAAKNAGTTVPKLQTQLSAPEQQRRGGSLNSDADNVHQAIDDIASEVHSARSQTSPGHATGGHWNTSLPATEPSLRDNWPAPRSAPDSVVTGTNGFAHAAVGAHPSDLQLSTRHARTESGKGAPTPTLGAGAVGSRDSNEVGSSAEDAGAHKPHKRGHKMRTALRAVVHPRGVHDAAHPDDGAQIDGAAQGDVTYDEHPLSDEHSSQQSYTPPPPSSMGGKSKVKRFFKLRNKTVSEPGSDPRSPPPPSSVGGGSSASSVNGAPPERRGTKSKVAFSIRKVVSKHQSANQDK